MSRMLKLAAVGAVFAVAAAAATAAAAQPPGSPGFGRGPGPGPVPASLTIFLRPNFQGQSGAYNGAVDRAPPTMTYGSLQMRGAWQFCSDVNFSGACTTVDRDVPDFRSLGLRTVGSFRPAGNPGPLPPGPPPGPPMPPPERGDNPNLRGVNSAFFARPAERGLRVEIGDDRDGRGPGRGGFDRRPDDRDVQREAQRFCQANGYRFVRAYDSEQVNRRFYLADVLCGRNER